MKRLISKYLYISKVKKRSSNLHSPETDVAIISCHQQVATLSLKELWFKTGYGKRERYIPIHELVLHLDLKVCLLLPAFHSITGCNLVSSFSLGKLGKKQHSLSFETKLKELMEDFGDNPCLSLEGDSVVACIRFVCSLYDRSLNDIMDINEVRYRLFTQKFSSGEKLPPTLDVLALHLKKANYQYYIWKHSCDPY